MARSRGWAPARWLLALLVFGGLSFVPVASAQAGTPARAGGQTGVSATANSVDQTCGAKDVNDLDYNGDCGPLFELPAWTDASGWTDPSKYTTIQLADLTGNGVDELIGRNSDGIEIWYFDTKVGQWRPATDAQGNPQVLTDFRDPLPSEHGPNWTQSQYYPTIQTANLRGPGYGADVIARFPDGMRVYRYTPPANNRNSINGGTWKLISQGGPFSDKDGYANPSQYLTIHATSASGGLPGMLLAAGRSGVGLVTYTWTGSGWQSHPDPFVRKPDRIPPVNPAYYLDVQWADLHNQSGDVFPAVVYRSGGIGPVVQYAESETNWTSVSALPGNAFSDSAGFNTSPSYYETLTSAQNIDGSGSTDIVGRMPDGLHVFSLNVTEERWQQLPTLTALAGTAQSLANTPSRWSSIRVGDVLGNKRDQVLALDGTQLQAWSYDPTTKAWTKLASPTPVNLGGAMWNSDASHYSTIEVGDVTGDGHDAVIARGPNGIRTWFYNRPGRSGWASYLPTDASSYPQFSGSEGKAFAELTAQAKQHGAIKSGDTSVRDVYATPTTAPSKDALSNLQQAILGFANCSGGKNGNPPYSKCTPPTGSAGFSTADWTEVVNQVLAEIGLVRDADGFFDQMGKEVRQNTFLEQQADLDAIGAELGIQTAEQTETTVQPSEIFGAMLSIAGALAGDLPGVGPALGAATTIVSLLSADSPSLHPVSKFQAKFADLKDRFATIVSQTNDGMQAQSQEVRNNYGLLSLLSTLTVGGGPWAAPDLVGLESASNEGFALWVYQQLMPTLYARYTITNCVSKFPFDTCKLKGAGSPAAIGAPPAFTAIGPLPTFDHGQGLGFIRGVPCTTLSERECDFEAVDNDITARVWNKPSAICSYQGTKAATKWKYGCNLGVNPASSITLADGPANGWDFDNYCGSYYIQPCQQTAGVATVGDASVSINGSLQLPAGFQVTSAAIAPGNLMYEPAAPDVGGATAVAALASGSPLPPITLVGNGTTFAAPAGAQATLHLGAANPAGQHTYALALNDISVAIPNACQALPASDGLATPQFQLTSTLQLSDGAQTQSVSVPALWQCVRDSAGVITKLETVPPTFTVPSPQAAAPKPELAATGVRTRTAPALGLAALLLVAGFALLALGRPRRAAADRRPTSSSPRRWSRGRRRSPRSRPHDPTRTA